MTPISKIKLILPLVVITILTIITIRSCEKLPPPAEVKVVKAKLNTEDMVPLKYNARRIVIEFADSVDGRPTYNVLFSDSTGVDSMYPEEVAHSLNTGVWQYNEDWKIQ